MYLYLLISLIILIVMGYAAIKHKSKKRKPERKKSNKRKKVRKAKSKKAINKTNNNTITEPFGNVSKFTEENSRYKIGNQKNINKIKICNTVLVSKEDNCNCFNGKKPRTQKEYENSPHCAEARNKSGCKTYKDCRKLFGTFMSMDEPEYMPEDWKDPLVEGSHNCYAYFLDDKIDEVKDKCKGMNKKNCGDLKPQPGHISIDNDHRCSKSLHDKLSLYTCPSLVERVMCDNEEGNNQLIKLTEFDKPCQKDFYKGVVVVDSGQHRKMKKGHTYHFYRQDSSGRWSHKPGTLPVEYIDASKKPIYVPHLADKNYNKKDPDNKDGIHYDKNCSYMCLPRNYKGSTKAI